MAAISGGNIFVLLGTSSAGKSSVISALKSIDPSWVEMGPDLAGFYHMGDMIKEKFPLEYEKLAQGLDHAEIAHAIADVFSKAQEGRQSNLSFLRWKNGSYSKPELVNLIHTVAEHPTFALLDQSMSTQDTAAKMNQKMIDFICSNSRQGRPVFVDGFGPDYLEAFLKQTAGYPVTVGLAYLSLPHLAERVTKRNATAQTTGDEAEIRSYQQITRQFLEHFKSAGANDTVIGYISLEKVEKAFSKMQPKDNQEADALKKLKTQVIEEYGLHHPNKVPLTSRFPCKVLVKTKQPPEQSAQMILSSL